MEACSEAASAPPAVPPLPGRPPCPPPPTRPSTHPTPACAGAKTGDKRDHGELWGMLNLLRTTRERMETLESVAKQVGG